MDNYIPIPDFALVPNAMRPSGIYCLMLRGRIVYIGKSLNVYARLSRHYTNQQRWKKGKAPYNANTLPKIEFDSVAVKFCPPTSLDREELVLIQRHQPQHNQRLVRREYLVDITTIPGIAEILARAPRRSAGVPTTFKKRSMSLNASA